MSLRWRLRLMQIGIYFGVFVLLVLLAASLPRSLGIGAEIAAGFWFLFGYHPTRWLMTQLVTSITCPGCGYEMDAVDRWSVGGYTDHRERHFLDVRSPLDGSRVGHTNCPQCGSTILLQ